jgi:hypothetical protein
LKYSVEATKQKLWELNKSIQDQYHANDNMRCLVASLLSKQGGGSQKEELGNSESTTITASTAATTMNPITNRSSSLVYPFQMASETVSQQDEDEEIATTCKSKSDLLMSFMPDRKLLTLPSLHSLKTVLYAYYL